MKYFCKIVFATLLTIAVISCGDSKSKNEIVELPAIDENTETEITVWSWNVAAKALMETAKTFNEKYPNIKVNVQEFGGAGPAFERYGIVLASGEGIPDIMTIESDYVQSFAEKYPKYFLDLKSLAPSDIDQIVDPSKVTTSYDSEGKLVAIAWDSGPVVMYYREDLFRQAGINPDSIATWEDFIRVGKEFQGKMPNVKFIGWPFVQDDGFWRDLMVQNNVYYLNRDGDITISSPKAVESIKILRRLIDEGLALNTVNWDGTIRANKNGEVATYIIGAWWGGTIKDQMPEMKGKWRAMKMPAFDLNGARASSHGGSTLAITSLDPIKQAASWAFIEHSLLTVDSQLLMYDKFGLFPSYIPVYDDERFNTADPYFGNQFYNQLLGEVTREIPPAIFTSDDYSEVRNIAVSVYEDILNNNSDIQNTLNNAANQISSSTGRKIAK